MCVFVYHESVISGVVQVQVFMFDLAFCLPCPIILLISLMIMMLRLHVRFCSTAMIATVSFVLTYNNSLSFWGGVVQQITRMFSKLEQNFLM